MFTQPCFIRKNTPELRKKLEGLGYLPPSKVWYDEDFAICTIYRDSTSGYFNARIDDVFEKIIAPSYSYIDCGTNEELFLALAALRDDSDKNQWFTDGKLWEKSNTDLPSHYMQLEGHKATVDEIIEHFKDK